MKNNPFPYDKKSDEDLDYVEWHVLMTIDSDPIVCNEKKEFKNLAPEIILKRIVFDTFWVSSANKVRLKYKTYSVDKNDNVKPFVINNWTLISIIDYFYYDLIWECSIQDPTNKLKTKKIENIEINDAISFFLSLTKFTDWNLYELYTENQELKAEIKKLKI